MLPRSPTITYIGRVRFRTDNRLFGIKQEDRLSHVHIIGKTGTGKSTLLEFMARQDLERGAGFCLIDPHGDLAERVNAAVPAWRRDDVIYLDAADPTQPFGYNPLRRVHKERIPLAASGFLEVLKKTWADAWGVRMEHILRNALYALLERPNSTLMDIPRLLGEKSFRREVSAGLANPPVRRFWEKDYDRFSFGYRADGAAAIENKVGAFLADPVMRRVVTAPEQEISIRRTMDEGKVLLVNLAKGRLGDDSAHLLGGLLVTTVGLAGFSRADTPPGQRRPFFLYVDEFQEFTTQAVAGMLSELRKYRVGITMAHQYLDQLETVIRDAVTGNTGTLISFRVSAGDARYIEREFRERFTANDLTGLANHEIYVRLMIDGQPSKAFSGRTVVGRSQNNVSPNTAVGPVRISG